MASLAQKTTDRLSRNLSAFEEKEMEIDNYISPVKKQIDEYNAVIVIDKGYRTIEATVLS